MEDSTDVQSQEIVHAFQDLPIDVARLILEFAALLHRDSARRLVLVSRVVRDWIDPILYHTVVLDGETAHRCFAGSCQSHLDRDPDFCSKHVRVLCIKEPISHPLLEYILTHCSGVDVFAAWFEAPLKLLGVMKVRRLSLGKRYRYMGGLSPTITHLQLSYDRVLELGWRWEELFRRCPSLTHIHVLAYCYSQPASFLSYIALRPGGQTSLLPGIMAAAPPSFEALIVEVSGEDLVGGDADIMDARIARDLIDMVSDKRLILLLPQYAFAHVEGVVCYPSTRDPMRDWGYRLGGELDAFEMADRHLATLKK